MPDFSVQLLGTSVAVWDDPATADAPSRLNPEPAHLQTYARAALPRRLTLSAVVGGVVGPLDAALGGRLFQVAWAEWSGPFPPHIVQTAGRSSVATIDLGERHVGHFVLVFRRPGGGAIAVPFDGEA